MEKECNNKIKYLELEDNTEKECAYIINPQITI